MMHFVTDYLHLDHKFFGAIKSFNEHGDKLGEKIQEGLVKNTPKIIFFMLPVLALFLKLLFRKEKLFYVEHFFSFGLYTQLCVSIA